MVDVDTANVRCFTNLEREGLMRIFFVALRAIGTHAFALDMGMYALLLTGDGLEVLHYFVDLAGQGRQNPRLHDSQDLPGMSQLGGGR